MKISVIVFVFLIGILTTQECRSLNLPPQEDEPEAVNLFYSDLTPFGEWIEFEPGQYAWHPSIIDPTWRPYTHGRWVWSDYGWYWITAEPFGWATYHYGRWYLDDTYGWIWIPDAVWGPAWVEWRCNDDYIGWAPLPPYARFHVTVGIRFTRRWSAPPLYWSFISYDHFASSSPYHDYVSKSNTRRLISTTRSAGRYQIDQNRIIDQGIDKALIERRTSNRIETAEVTETRERGVERSTTGGSRVRVEVYRPRPEDIGNGTRHIEARRAESRPSLDIDRVGRYRTRPQREGQSPRGNTQRFPQSFKMPGQQLEQSRQSDQRLQRPDVTRDRMYRSRQQFPSPKVDRMTPRRPAESRDQDRSDKRRGRF